MIRAALLLCIATQPAVAQTSLPPQLICDFVGICDATDVCTTHDPPQPVFTLLQSGQEWLWDVRAEWQGFPVLIANNAEDALTQHRANPRFGLALIPSGVTTNGQIVLDGHGLPAFDNGTLDPNAMRHHCREASDEMSS